MSNLIALVIGVISSLISASLFLLFLKGIKPKLYISKEIAKSETPNDKEHQFRYIIKVVNGTRRSAIDIKVRLDFIIQFNVYGGTINTRKEIPLKISSVYEISGFSGKEKTEIYTWRFITYENLEAMWTDDDAPQFFRFQIYAVDSLSNFARVFTQDYFTKGSIRKGDFEYGSSLQIR